MDKQRSRPAIVPRPLGDPVEHGVRLSPVSGHREQSVWLLHDDDLRVRVEHAWLWYALLGLGDAVAVIPGKDGNNGTRRYVLPWVFCPLLAYPNSAVGYHPPQGVLLRWWVYQGERDYERAFLLDPGRWVGHYSSHHFLLDGDMSKSSRLCNV